VQRSVPEVPEATEAMEWLEREPFGIRSGTCPVPLWLSICVAAKQRGDDSALFWGKRRKWGAVRRAAYFIRLTQKGDGPICT